MNEEQKELANRILEGGFGRAGMWTNSGSVFLDDPVICGDEWSCLFAVHLSGPVWAAMDEGESIDLCHPATIGIIEHLARDAWKDWGDSIELSYLSRGEWYVDTSYGAWFGSSRGEVWARFLLDAPC